MSKHRMSYGPSQSPLHIPQTTFGRPKEKGGFDLLKDYQNFELPASRLEGMREHFEHWMQDDSYIKDYEKLSFTKSDAIIVRLYRFENSISDVLLGTTESVNNALSTDSLFFDKTKLDKAAKDKTKSALMGIKVLPYVKVLNVHPENTRIKVGDILCASEDICQIKTSVAWLEWKKGMENGDFTDVPEPEQFVGTLARWKEKMIRLNPFEITDDDKFTFVLSDMEFRIIYRRK